jgi:Cu2+-exporting ATPase
VPARLGRPGWLGETVEAPVLVTAFQLGARPVRVLRFRDPIRPGATSTVEALRRLGLDPAILSGDRADAVAPVARELDLPATAALTPGEKLAAIEALRASGRRVLMVGDGLNDGPALAAGHVSLAPASASDVGQTAADLVFLGDSLDPVPVAIRAARRTLAVVRQNFALAIGYNLFAVPLAIFGMVTPLVAAAAMSTSSLLVVGNALRLRRCAR